MFKFGFGSSNTKKRLQVPRGAYVIQEHELKSAVGGGTPVQQMLYSMGAPEWVHTTTSAAGAGIGDQYSRYTQMFPAAQWQSGLTWGEATDDIKQSTRYNYYDG